MKKTLGVILFAVMAIALLSACGGGVAAGQAGGAAADSITVVSREDGSGTRGAFVELTGVLSEDDQDLTTTEAATVSSTSAVMTTVAGDVGAIGYISLGSLNDTVKALDIDGVTPSVEAVKDGSYGISRPFNLAVNGQASEVAQDFIDYILSAEGQAVVVENGYISIDDAAAPYSGATPSGKVVVAGSSSVTPVMEKLKEAYAAVNSNAEIEIQMSDSSTGMTAAIDGICDIGMASRELKDSELESLTPIVMAMDGIAVIVNNDNPVTALTVDDIKAIYLGETTTWGAI